MVKLRPGLTLTKFICMALNDEKKTILQRHKTSVTHELVSNEWQLYDLLC